MFAKYPENQIRFLIFAAAAIIHILLLFFAVLPAGAKYIDSKQNQESAVIKLINIEERTPEPPPVIRLPPPAEPYIETSADYPDNTSETIAENIIVTEEKPDQAEMSAPVNGSAEGISAEIKQEYLPVNRITDPPGMPENEIRKALVYPPVALRARVQGIVYLDLFIDAQGNLADIKIYRETPENRGFAEAAVNAVKTAITNGGRIIPGKLNGENVAVQYRYPVEFRVSR